MITTEDRKWLSDHYPGIRVMGDTQLRGFFRFKAHQVSGNARVIRILGDAVPDSQDIRGAVCDRYQISADLKNRISPKVWETEGRLQAFSRKMGVTPIDVHTYQGGSLCLGFPDVVADVLARHRNIQGLFDRLILPYFYHISYWEKYGHETWPSLSHEKDLAFLQQVCHDSKHDPRRLKEVLLPVVRKYVTNSVLCAKSDKLLCLCKSGKKMSECHIDGFEGREIIRDRVDTANLSPLVSDVLGKGICSRRANQYPRGKRR